MIDADGSGTIDRLEYIEYLVSADTEGGRSHFDASLKILYDNHDEDKDGLLNFEELFNLVVSDFEDEIKGKAESS